MSERNTFSAVAPHLAAAALDALRDALAYQLGITPTDAPMLDDLFDILGALLEGETTTAQVRRALPRWRPEPGSLAHAIEKIVELADAPREHARPAQLGTAHAPLVEAVSDDAQAVYLDGRKLRMEIRDGRIVVDAGDRQVITEQLRRGAACSVALHQITNIADAPEDFCAGTLPLPSTPLDDDEVPGDVILSVSKLAKEYVTSQRMSDIIARLRMAN